MATYHIRIDEKKALGRSIVALLKSVPEAVSFEKPARQSQTTHRKGPLYKSLESAFRDVRDIMDGKQKEVTLEEFLNEL
jgi:hypothetical protein